MGKKIKRVARVPTVLDKDDVEILKLLYKIKSPGFILFEDLQKEIGLSTRRALLNHIYRLHAWLLIKPFNLVGFEYRKKAVNITKKGRKLIEVLLSQK